MNRSQLHWTAYAVLFSTAIVFSLALATTLTADTLVTGDVTPPLPWGPSTSAYIGRTGSGNLVLDAGSQLASWYAYLGYSFGSTGSATVTGSGSQWNSDYLYVGFEGSGTLSITDGGLVSVSTTLWIDYNGGDDSFINMSTGGMLALASDEHGDDSLDGFLALVEGSDAIRYWDEDISDWDLLTNATYGDDYTLEYLTTGDLAGYTLLTVGVRPSQFAADFDADGDDFLIWQSAFQDNAGGDADGDGDTDGDDFLIWQTEFGSGSGFATTAVPEPASLSLLLGASLITMLRRRRRVY